MTIPAVAFIEMAIAQVKGADPATLLAFDQEIKEFRSLGQARLDAYAKSLPADLSDLERGYLLGLETARVELQGLQAAVRAGVSL